MRVRNAVVAILCALAMWSGPAQAFVCVGAGSVWGMPRGSCVAIPYTGDAAGVVNLNAAFLTTGLGQMGPGTEGLTLPAYRPGMCLILAWSDGYRMWGTPFEAWPRGIRQFRVDSLGVHADSALTARILNLSGARVMVPGSGGLGHGIPDGLGTDYNFLLDGLGQSPIFGTTTSTTYVGLGNVDLSNTSYVRVKNTGGTYQQVMGAAGTNILRLYSMADGQPIRVYNHGQNAVNFDIADSGAVTIPNGPLLYRPEQTLADNATPSVFSGNQFVCSPASPVTITDFSRGTDGQRISVRFTNANATINNSGNFVLNQGAFVSAAGSLLNLSRRSDGLWHEEARVPTATFAGPVLQAIYCSTATMDFDLSASVVQDQTITVTGAALNDIVTIGAPNGSVTSTVQYTGWVSSANTVTIRATEATAPGTGLLSATLWGNGLSSPTPGTGGYVANSMGGGSDNFNMMVWTVPTGYVATTSWKLWWTSSIGAAGNCLYEFAMFKITPSSGFDFNTATFTASAQQTLAAPATADVLSIDTMPTPSVSLTAGDTVVLKIRRLGNNVPLDTSAAASNFIGMYLTAAGENPASGTFRATVLHY